MARKKVIDLNADSTIEWSKPGQTLEGYYIGFKTVNSVHGASKLHVLQTDSGTVGCWGSAQLDSKLGSISRGNYVWITFGGKVKIQGGKTMKNFAVDFDDEDTVEVGNTAVQYSSDVQDDEANDYAADDANELPDADPEEPEADDETEYEANPAAETFQKRGTPIAPTPAMKSKAAALISKARSKTSA